MARYMVRIADSEKANFCAFADRNKLALAPAPYEQQGWISAHQHTTAYEIHMSKEDELALRLSTTAIGMFCINKDTA